MTDVVSVAALYERLASIWADHQAVCPQESMVLALDGITVGHAPDGTTESVGAACSCGMSFRVRVDCNGTGWTDLWGASTKGTAP